MKRLRILIMLLIVISTLTACGKNNNEPISVNSYSNKDGFINFSSDIAESEKGYYILSGSIGDRFITYVDKKSGKSTVLCSNINCTHTMERVPSDCDSYVGLVLPESLNYYNGYIYYIGYEAETYKCSLNRILSDGTEHEKVCELGVAPDISNAYYSYVVTDSYIFYSESIGVSSEKNTATLKKYSFANKSADIIYSYQDNSAKIFDLKMCEDNIYFRQVGDGQLLATDLYEFSLSNNKKNKIAENVCSYTLKQNEKLAYWKVYDGIYERILATEDEEKIFNSDEDTMLGFIASSGDEYYIYNISNKKYKKDTEVYIGRLEKGNIETPLYENRNDYIKPLYVGSDRIFVDIYNNDGKFCGYSDIKDGKVSMDVINVGINR